LGENLRLLESRRSYVDMVELRADLLDLAELHQLSSFPRKAGLPVVLAIRRDRDGGRWRGDEAERRQLFARSLSGGYEYVELEYDLEDAALAKAVSRAGGRVIRSLYDFSGVPKGLSKCCRNLPHGSGEIPKIEVQPQGSRELPELIRAYQRLMSVEKILLGMGEFGLFSRILTVKLNCYLTYCSLSDSPEATLGAIDPQTLVELYRFRNQDRDTFVCGVIGNPIAHSRSPEFHNRGYKILGLNGVYLPFLVDDVPAFFQSAELLDLRGVSVTMPHKQAVLAHLQERDGSVEQIGACNPVVRRRGEGWYGTNTDVAGFLAPLESQIPQFLSTKTRATVIGAGGGARSVVYALRSRGIRPLILNRTPEKAKALAGIFDCEWAGLDSAGIEGMRDNADLIVQATGVGMVPDSDADPLPEYQFGGSEVVYDLVYQPLVTAFLQRARDAGCRIISGLDMLWAQGAFQFEHYTGAEYPRQALDQAPES
jgi:3-dehydroquinate dehydratase/shikimate dehydrogenase